MYRYFNSILEIKNNQLFMHSMGSLLNKDKLVVGLANKLPLPLNSKIVELDNEKVTPTLEPPIKPEEPETPARPETSPEKPEKQRSQKMGPTGTSKLILNELHGDVIPEEDDLDLPDDDKKEIFESLPQVILPDRATKDKDLFRTYFCRHFDTIIDIDKANALSLGKEIIDPLVLELKDYINLEALQQHLANSKPQTRKDKILLALLKVWRWIKKAAYFLIVDLLGTFIKNFFTNQFVVIFLETVLAMIYVAYSQSTYTLYPIILWIFLNVYPKFDSILALNMKIWLLMIPTGINSLIAKQQVSPELANSTNNDFNFSYKGEYKVLDISTLGVVLMSFVILEMIIMASKNINQDDKSAPDPFSAQKAAESHRASQLFYMVVKLLYNNSLYLIMINIYLIALDINIISLGLIVYFIRLILIREIGDKTYYTLFWYNQISIFIRYVYNHHKPTKATPHTNLYKLIGVEESDNMSSQTKLLLNFSLQLLLIIVIFCKRNQGSLGFFSKQESDHSARRAFSSLTGVKLILNNLLQLLRFSSFHCLPWLTYLVVYLAMILTSTTLITLTELCYLSYLFVSHARASIEQRFGGLHLTKGIWKGMITYCAVMALGRYCLWFITQPYLQENFDWIKRMHSFISHNLGFIGLLPSELKEAYLELLPSFLSMYLGSLVLHRITMIEYTIKHEPEIMKIDLEEPDVVPTIEVVRIDSKTDDPKDDKRRSVFTGKRGSIRPIEDLKTKLNDKELEEGKQREIYLKARREVIGDINVLR